MNNGKRRAALRGAPAGEARAFAAAAAILLSAAAWADAPGVSRQALRDGLWDVARAHAAESGDDARSVTLESFAREGKWRELLETLDSWRDDDKDGGDECLYYRALALAECGEKKKAASMLADAAFETQDFRRLAARLRARLAADMGDKELALALVKESGFETADVDSRMTAASIFAMAGDRPAAEKIWRDIAVPTNVARRAFAVAAANLSDAALLRMAAEKAQDAQTRRFAGLRLGRLLIKSKDSFDEGVKTIRAIVKDSPDAEGARDAAIALADMFLSREAWQQAADEFRDVMEIWPDAAHVFSVQEGRGWALLRLGRAEEALEAFSRAEDAATGDDQRAMAILEQGDVLSDSQRGDEAMAKYRAVLEKYPQSPAAGRLKEVVRRRELEAQGRELYRDYRFADAQKIFESIAESDPSKADRANFLQALCLYGQGLDAEAEAKAKAIADGTGDAGARAEATLWLAKLAFNTRRWEESGSRFSAYADMAQDSPRAPGALVWAARAAFAANDFGQAIRIVTHLVGRYPNSPEKARAFAIQGEALMELGRYDEAVLVLERALMEKGLEQSERLKTEVLKADALFAMGADNAARYREALDAYRALRLGESLPPGLRLAVSFKMGRVLEKLKRMDEAIDQYYTGVVLAYREGRQKGLAFDDEARAAFARAAFRLADEYESRGRDFQAMHILELVIASDVPAADEAEKRLDRIQTKGKFL